MTRITFSPIEEIIVLDEIRHEDPQELFREILIDAPAGAVATVIWAEGIVFRHSALPLNTPPVAQERMKGKVYWSFVRYAEMPEYKESESIEGKTVKIVKTQSSALVEVARELKKRLRGEFHGTDT